MRESEEEEMTSVTSGRRCSALLTKSGPLGSLVRTLLESPLWSKEGYSLRWEAISLCSERVTDFTDSSSDNPSPSNESAETLRALDTPSSRCLFRLRLSVLPTEETGSSLLPTPMSVEVHHRERTQRAIDQGQTSFRGRPDKGKDTHPSGLMDYLQFKGLLKTPSAMDAASERMTSKGESGTSGTLAQEMMSGYVEKRGFLLPTPTAVDNPHPQAKIDSTGRRKSKEGSATHSQGLSDLAHHGLLPTPTFQDFKKRGPNSKQQGIGEVVRKMLPTPIAGDWKGQVKGQGKGEETMLSGMVERMAKAMLPTPRANEGGACREIHWAHNRMERPSGCQATITDLAHHGLLPTPTARDEKNPSSPDGERIARKREQGWTIELNDLAAMGSLPTPNSSPKTGGGTFRLSPLFTEEMMGFPFLWVTLPFLRQNGEPRPSKPTETP